MSAGVLEIGSLTTSWSVIMFVPPRRFSRILISLLIFFFFTGYMKTQIWGEMQNFGKIITRDSGSVWECKAVPIFVFVSLPSEFSQHTCCPPLGSLLRILQSTFLFPVCELVDSHQCLPNRSYVLHNPNTPEASVGSPVIFMVYSEVRY